MILSRGEVVNGFKAAEIMRACRTRPQRTVIACHSRIVRTCFDRVRIDFEDEPTLTRGCTLVFRFSTQDKRAMTNTTRIGSLLRKQWSRPALIHAAAILTAFAGYLVANCAIASWQGYYGWAGRGFLTLISQSLFGEYWFLPWCLAGSAILTVRAFSRNWTRTHIGAGLAGASFASFFLTLILVALVRSFSDAGMSH